METTVKMVGSRFTIEVTLDQVLDNFSKADKFSIEITKAQIVAAVKAAAPRPPVPGAAKPGPKPKTPETPTPAPKA